MHLLPFSLCLQMLHAEWQIACLLSPSHTPGTTLPPHLTTGCTFHANLNLLENFHSVLLHISLTPSPPLPLHQINCTMYVCPTWLPDLVLFFRVHLSRVPYSAHQSGALRYKRQCYQILTKHRQKASKALNRSLTLTVLTFWILSSHSLFCVSSAMNVWCFSHFLWSCWVSSQVESRTISIFSITQSPSCKTHTYTVIEISPARLFSIVTPNQHWFSTKCKIILQSNSQKRPWSMLSMFGSAVLIVLSRGHKNSIKCPNHHEYYLSIQCTNLDSRFKFNA